MSARVSGLRRARAAALRAGDHDRVRRLDGALRQEAAKSAAGTYRRGLANAARAGALDPTGFLSPARALLWADR